MFANFFFWKPGTPLQKSLSGLYRSLLHDILDACPNLTPIVLPNQWKDTTSMPWQVQTQLHIPTKDIKAAFSRLKANQRMYQDHCFCYFIDGLDEFEETPQEDYKSVVEILSEWTLAYPGTVKICVSSREYNVFLNGFSNERRLRLQDLTRADMELYVRNKLRGPEIGDFEPLMYAIVEKGDGIFLWVALVVKTLRERIEDGHGLLRLESELDSLPRELENLLKSLLDSLDSLYKQRFYQLFTMLSESQASKVDGCLSPLACSFLEDFEKDPTFAMEADFPCFNMEEKAKVERETLARKHINGYCKGLLEFKTDRVKRYRLAFTHRSIPEFLETLDTKNGMNLCLKDFDAVEAISQLLLAEIRCTNPKSIPRDEMSFLMYRIVSLRYTHKVDKAPFIYLEYLSSTITLHEIPERPEEMNMDGQLFCAPASCYSFGHHSVLSRTITSPLYTSAFLGDFEYVKWKLDHDREIVGSEYQIAVLLCGTYCWSGRNKWSKFAHLDLFLDMGLSPQALIHKTPATNALPKLDELTFWVHFILKLLEGLGDWKPQLTAAEKRGVGRSIEYFLRFHADPRLAFWSETHDNPYSSIQAEYAGRRLKGLEWRVNRKNVFFYELFSKLKSGKTSLRDLIPCFRFENQDSILRLIDRNLEELERGSQGATESEFISEKLPSKHLSGSQSDLEGEPFSESKPKKEEQLSLPQSSNSRASDIGTKFVVWSYFLPFLLGTAHVFRICNIH